MRYVLCLLLAGCFGRGARPVVTPSLTELPPDREKRNDVLDSASARPDPELRKNMKPRERKLETGAAIGAAILGEIFSTTKNAHFGVASIFEENDVSPSASRPQPKRAGDAPESPPPPPPEPGTLVPWVKLAPPASP